MGKIKLLDCTLRDGGFLNDWNFGHDNVVCIFERLVSSNVEMIEIGFLDERQPIDMERTIQPDVASMDKVYEQLDKGKALIVGMIDYGTCHISNISSCSDSFIDGIRVIFKKENMRDAIAYCKEIKDLGYQVFVQAVSITSYQDCEFLELIKLVNQLDPTAFSLVDTYGLLHKNQLMHYFKLADEGLNQTIGIGYHSHNNFQLGYANCIELIESPMDRDLIVDGSLYGMGKGAGNTPIELLATYLNERKEKNYKTYHLLEAIDTTVLEISKQIPWGYSFKFFISASNDCHPNYVSYLMDKKKLSVKSINEILRKITEERKLNYNEEYIEQLYIQYQKNDCDDREDFVRLQKEIKDKTILLLGPGQNIEKQKEKVNLFIQRENPIMIAINYIPNQLEPQFVFISNAKRYVQLSTKLSQIRDHIGVIATSNVTKATGEFTYLLCYSNLLDEQALLVDNPMIMLIKLLDEIGVAKIALAGFDGYVEAESANYINPNMEYSFSRTKAREINKDTVTSIERLHVKCDLQYVTDSLYPELKV